jgi:hypothetical protein
MKSKTKTQMGLSRSEFLQKFALVLPLLPAATLLAQTADPAASPEGKADEGKLRALVELARSDVRVQKSVILAQNLPLSDSEAEKFWPLQRQYDLEFTRLLDERYAAIIQLANQYGTMTDEQATKLAETSFQIESKRTALKKKYYAKFSKVISALKAARFFQIENVVNMILDLQLTASLPLLK